MSFAQAIAVGELRERVGANLQEVAQQMRDKIELGLDERYRDLAVAASILSADLKAGRMHRVQAMLNELQATYDDYAWIGLASPRGDVMASANGVLAGADVSARPWFKAAQRGPYFGDVHSALLLEEILNPEGGEPLRFVDVAVPVLAEDTGELIGVLGAHLDWRWISRLEQSIIEPLEKRLQAELLIVSRDSSVLLGPSDLRDTTLSVPSVRAALQGKTGHVVESWSNGNRYLIGYCQIRDSVNVEGLDWAVMVRKDVASAFAPSDQIRNGIVLAGLLTAILFCLFAWLTARWVSKPLLDMAREADAINQGEKDADISARDDFEEVSVLSRAMNRLIGGLKGKESELRRLNATLEERVVARTEDLESANEALREEIAAREVLRTEREQMIRQLKELANTDSLTGISNRRHFFNEGERVLKRVTRRGTGAAVILFDADHFKRINDTYGHGVGDDALNHLVSLTQRVVRDVDLFARVGGEEFAVLLEDESGENVVEIAERMRAMVEANPLVTDDGEVSLTISLGVARLKDCERADLDLLLAFADRALYAAKEGGRNRVCLYSDQSQNEKKPLG